ncbi:zinc finger protein 658B-like [Ylistrum balloti]|uniref:zinc finger protein 658B-like n=1 Tax=Ylistrum balloti TaxID=509963 RepID=UPI00290596A5|nr:zinc finger protein 658B-like [Ylistrum balloti]XP_060077040.1 zinc finger protein 658B-like [Ylistrum balloti]XP_060077041.1 zinc finger protein 658B-like [Ylistrum balloti]
MEERVFPVEIEVPGFQCGLMETLYGLWQRGQLCDAVIHTSNGSVEAHRAVLCAASPYLHNMEVSDRQQFRVSHYHLQVGRLEDVTVILRLFYTGKFAVSSENVENLMQLCLFLQVGEAVKVCQRFFNGWHSQKGQTTRNLPESLFLLENKLGLRDGSPNIPVGVSIQGYSQLPNTSPHNSPGTESVQQDQLNVHTDQHYTHVDRNQQAAVDMSNAYDVHMCVSRENHISCDSTRHEGQRSPVTISSQELTFLQKVRRSDPDDSLDGQRSMQIPNDCDEDTEKLASCLLANDVDNLSNSSTSDTQGFVNSSLSEDVTKKEGETKRSQSSPNINTSPLSPEVDDSYSKFNSDNLTSHQQWPINCRDGNEKVQNRSSFSQHKKLCHSKSSTFDSSKSLSTNDELGSSLECNEDNVSTLCTDSGNTIKKMEKTIESKTINTCSLRSNLRSKHGSENLKSNKHAKKQKLGPTSDGKNQEKVDTSKPKVQRVKGRDPVNIATRTKTKRGSKDTKKQAQANVICTLCKLVFTSKMERAKHKREVHKLKPDGYKCAVCKGTFSTLHQLKTHKEQAHPEKIRCFKCDGHPSFSTVSELENHRRNQHVRDQTIICRICRETFATRDAKNDHVKKVHPYGKNCPECNTKFDNWKHLVDHRNHKHNVPFEANKYEIFSCDIENCDYQTVDKYRYLCHKRDVHCCDRSHTCLTCNSTFKSKRALKSHQEVHLDRDQRNGSQCDQCGKKFLSVTYLKTHIDTMHSEEKKPIKKQFLCHLCPNSFRDKHFFHSHMLRAHEVAPPADLKLHRCTHCDFFTVQKSHLRKHMRHHSTEAKEYECNSCGKKFLTEDCLGRHIQRHQMKDEFCPIPGCGYSTKYKSNLKNHVARIHTQKDLKPFLCPYCDYRCKEKGNLNKHITGKHKMEVVTVAKLRKNAIKTGTGYPNFVTMSQSNTAASYSEEENMESQVNMAMTMSASYNQYQLDYNMQVYNGVT